MARVILHIGMEKTGSSALQRFFARNRVMLRMAGLRYPRMEGAPAESHCDLVDAIAADGTGAELVETYAAAVEDAATTLISAEGLSAPDPGFAQAFGPWAERFDVTVVVFLRRQDEWALSAYRQAVIDPGVAEARGFADWLDDPVTRARLDYATMLEGWNAVFGADRIRVLRYPHEIPVVPAFLRAAGLPDRLRLLPERNLRVNESVGDAALLEALERNGGTGEVPQMPQPARDALLGELEPGNRWIAQTFRPDLGSLFGLDSAA
ncbi:MAG: hypothetical protein AAGE76_09855 [Pseudomonadota bacterium]